MDLPEYKARPIQIKLTDDEDYKLRETANYYQSSAKGLVEGIVKEWLSKR